MQQFFLLRVSLFKGPVARYRPLPKGQSNMNTISIPRLQFNLVDLSQPFPDPQDAASLSLARTVPCLPCST
jgi:hypothetical protein